MSDRNITSRNHVYAWLGFWRDQMPAEAVTQLQDILGPLQASDEPPAVPPCANCETWKATLEATERDRKRLELRVDELEGAAPPSSDVLRNAARYRWLHDDNAYAPEEAGIIGGEELDRLCDAGIAQMKSGVVPA